MRVRDGVRRGDGGAVGEVVDERVVQLDHHLRVGGGGKCNEGEETESVFHRRTSFELNRFTSGEPQARRFPTRSAPDQGVVDRHDARARGHHRRTALR